MPRDLRDLVVVITGAGSGIGRATATAFVEEGARVHGVDVEPERLAELALELTERGGRFAAHVLDVRDAQGMLRLAEEVVTAHGRVDVLHNNAGLVVGGPVEQLTLEDWRLAVDVNLMGVIHGIHAFVPHMIAQGGGAHIVNTGSLAGLLGFPVVSPYSATKFAVVGLSESLDAELAPHDIRVTAICPGAVRTRALEGGRLTLPGRGMELLGAVMDRFAMSPEQVAREVLRVVRRRQGGVRPIGRETLPLWLFRRSSVAAYEHLMRLLSRRVLGRRGG
ncbi:MAG: SDR family oxidoreductase [bacterium]